MLRLQLERSSQVFPCVYHSKHTKPTNPLHCLGKKLSFTVGVSTSAIVHLAHSLNFQSELFGTSEADTEEFDYSADADNGALGPVDRPIKR